MSDTVGLYAYTVMLYVLCERLFLNFVCTCLLFWFYSIFFYLLVKHPVHLCCEGRCINKIYVLTCLLAVLYMSKFKRWVAFTGEMHQRHGEE